MQNLSGKRTDSKRYRRKTAAEQKKSGAQKRKNSGSAVFAVFFNQSHVLQEKFRRRWYFFLKTVRMCDPHRSDHTSNGKGEKKMDALNQAIAQISDVLWNSVLLFLLVGTGVYFSVRTRFVQVRKFKTAWNRVFGGFLVKG